MVEWPKRTQILLLQQAIIWINGDVWEHILREGVVPSALHWGKKVAGKMVLQGVSIEQVNGNDCIYWVFNLFFLLGLSDKATTLIDIEKRMCR